MLSLNQAQFLKLFNWSLFLNLIWGSLNPLNCCPRVSRKLRCINMKLNLEYDRVGQTPRSVTQPSNRMIVSETLYVT